VVDQGRIVLADEAAQQAGIAGGIGVAAARLLVPTITLLARDRAQETATLRALACWAGAFTPRISLTPDTMLLEIGSCLRLFGGVDTLLDAVRTGVEAQGFCAELAAAPTPLAAQWLAQCATAAVCLDAGPMRRHLERLPLDVLPERAATALRRFGAATLADVRRLPGAALARRLGLAPLQLVARAFGELADARADFIFPDRFALPLPLPAAVDNAAALLFAARRLTGALAGWLAARQAGVREFTLHLVHRQDETRLRLQFADLSADDQRFARVLRERLENFVLAAPVESLRLEATSVAPLAGRNQRLFNDADAGQDAIDALLERLGARLGTAQIYRLSVHDDHRPERATRHAALFGKIASTPGDAPPRPLWRVAPPQPLTEVDGRPYHRGHLKLLAGPERIEAGWWDGGERVGEAGEETGGDIRRDYFIALGADGCWLWIYRTGTAPGGWFLHGFFA